LKTRPWRGKAPGALLHRPMTRCSQVRAALDFGGGGLLAAELINAFAALEIEREALLSLPLKGE
jgi:hypothetical protein